MVIVKVQANAGNKLLWSRFVNSEDHSKNIREPSAKQNKNQNLKSKIRPRYIIDITKNIDQNNKYYNNIDHMQCFFSVLKEKPRIFKGLWPWFEPNN